MEHDLSLEEFPAHTREAWKEAATEQLGGKPFESLVKKTYEGIDIQPMYFAEDLEGLPQVNALPGLRPYLRGSTPLGAAASGWTVAQEIPYPEPARFNQAVRHDLQRGLGAISVPLDRASCLGLSPVEATEALIGEGGVSIATMADWAEALDGIDLSTVPIFVQPGASGLGVAALLVATHEASGGRARRLSGVIASDPLGELARHGYLPASLDRLWLELAQLTSWARDFAPALRTVAATGHAFHEAGGSAVQELGFTLGAAVETLRALGRLGLEINEVAPRFAWSLSLGSDFFMETAKLRAARLLWEQVVEAFGGSDEAQKLFLHARTSRWNKTATDPWVNMLRVTTEAFSGICAGCDALHVGAFDEALGLPTDFSRRVARNVQIVLREEAHAGRVVDPAGGAYYVEWLTNELARRSWELFQEVERRGGLLASLREGWIQAELGRTAAERAKSIGTRRDVFVGTNKYPNLAEKPVQASAVDREELVASRRQAVIRFRAKVDRDRRRTELTRLAALSDRPSAMEAAIGAARAGAVLPGLLCALRGEKPRGETIAPVGVHRGAAAFEALRRAMADHSRSGGEVMKVFLANLGPIPQHKARADFSRGFFELGALEVVGNDGFSTVEAAADAALASSARVVCICSTDASYPDLVPPLVRLLKERAPDLWVVLAGYPKEHVEAFRAAGVDDFIHVRSNALEQLENLQRLLGVLK
ncbi:MAG: methylmalonyl-CoA mutase family protein [Polyangia bacterium]|jgi:methylmalonyl-CoA mutase|nr:methylmalonyl-CoA mutase family protein [Polyangia bacterium]